MWRAASLVRLPVGSPSCGRFFASSRAAAPLRWARPLRAARPGPAIASPLRVAGPLGCPPALSLGPCAPFPAPWALAAAPALWLPLGALRAPCSVALASLVGALAQRVGLPGPPVLAPFGASGPGPPRPGLSPPSGGGFPPRPGLFFLLACCARCAIPPAGVSPLRPSRPRRPRWGLRGSGLPAAGGCGPRCFAAPPGMGSSSRAPSHCSGAGKGLAGQLAALALAAALFLAQGLDKGEHLRYYVGGLPVPVLRHPPARVSVGRRKKLAA